MQIGKLRKIKNGQYTRRVDLSNSTVIYDYKQIYHSCINRLVIESTRKRHFHQNIRQNTELRAKGRDASKEYERLIYDMIPQLQLTS